MKKINDAQKERQFVFHTQHGQTFTVKLNKTVATKRTATDWKTLRKVKRRTLSISGELLLNNRIVATGQINSILLALYYSGNIIDFPAELVKIVYLWDKYHLNCMMLGTKAQEDALKTLTSTVNLDDGDEYDRKAQFLKDIGLYEDRGYIYGTKWLCKTIPSKVFNELDRLFKTPKNTSKKEKQRGK